MARSSATSITMASLGSRPQMKVTTQPSHAGVDCIEQSSQLMVRLVMNRCSHGGVTVKLGGMVHAFVLIDGQPHRVADLAEELAGIDGVSEVYSVAGHADIVAVVRVRRHEDLADIVTRHISCLDGVVDTRTLIAFRSFSKKDLDAIWDLGAD